jgi:hypothetical protein
VLQPSLYRVAVGVLALACAGNLFLVWLTTDDDTFANIVGVASGVVAAVLLATAFFPALVRLREEALLLALVVWLSNAIEFAFQDGVRWQTQVRQCSFYLAFAGLALGTYLAQRVERTGT